MEPLDDDEYLPPGEARAIAFNRWRLYNERRRMKKKLGQVLERVRANEEESSELRIAAEELKVLEKQSVSKIATLTGDNVELTKQVISLRNISLLLNKQLAEHQAKVRELEIAKAGLEEALLACREVVRSEGEARKADNARISSERDRAVDAQKVLLDRLSAKDTEINSINDENRKLSIAVTALQRELCDLKCRAEQREKELKEALRTRHEEILEEFREERKVLLERVGGAPAAPQPPQQPAPAPAPAPFVPPAMPSSSIDINVDVRNTTNVPEGGASSSSDRSAELEGLRRSLAASQTMNGDLSRQLSALEATLALEKGEWAQERDRLNLTITELNVRIQSISREARHERESTHKARANAAERIGSLRDAYLLRAAFDSWRYVTLKRRRRELRAAYQKVQDDKVALLAQNDEKRLCIAAQQAAHRWRVFTLVNNLKAVREEGIRREREVRREREAAAQAARRERSRLDAVVTLCCLTRDEWTIMHRAFHAWRLACEFLRVLRAQQKKIEGEQERRNHDLIYGRDSSLVRTMKVHRNFQLLLRTFRGWRAAVPKKEKPKATKKSPSPAPSPYARIASSATALQAHLLPMRETGVAVGPDAGEAQTTTRFLEDRYRDAGVGVEAVTSKAIQALPPFRFGKLDFQQRARALENKSYQIAGRIKEVGSTLDAAQKMGHYGFMEGPVTAAAIEDGWAPMVVKDELKAM